MHSSSVQESPVAGAAFPSVRLKTLRAVLGRHLVPIVFLIVFPMVFTTALNYKAQFLRDPDIWWHLADARQLSATHHFIRVETSSFTVAGQAWVNPEWLAELPYWYAYHALGLRGLYLVTWMVLAANLLLFYWRGIRRSGHAGAALLASVVGMVLLTVNAGPRTIAIAYLAMAGELMILDAAERGNKRMLWLLPPLFCVWVNLHGSWLIGLGLLALYVACGAFSVNRGAFQQQAFTRSDLKRLLAVFAASVFALLINPYGWRLVWNPFDMMLNQKLNLAMVQEWKPLSLSTAAGATAFAVLCFLVVAYSLKGRKWRIWEMAIVFFAWYAALDHMRFLFMAAVLTVPLIADAMQHAFEFEPVTNASTTKNTIYAVAAVCVAAFLFPSESKLEKRLGEFVPLQSIAAVQSSWRTFNYDSVGGMMALASKPSFLDSRFDVFEHRGVLKDYLQVSYTIEPLQVLDQYRIDHVIVLDNMGIASLLHQTPGWQIIRSERVMDGTCLTFARTGGK